MSEFMDNNDDYLVRYPGTVQDKAKAFDMAEAANEVFRRITAKNIALVAVQSAIRDGTASRDFYSDSRKQAITAVLERALREHDFRHLDSSGAYPNERRGEFEPLGRYRRGVTDSVAPEMIAHYEIRDTVGCGDDGEILTREPITNEKRDQEMHEYAEGAGERFDFNLELLKDAVEFDKRRQAEDER